MRPILPVHYTRCITSTCKRRENCARHMVMYERGRPFEDFSSVSGFDAPRCLHFLPLDYRVEKPEQETKPAIRGIC